jgi:hypothetical protein
MKPVDAKSGKAASKIEETNVGGSTMNGYRMITICFESLEPSFAGA